MSTRPLPLSPDDLGLLNTAEEMLQLSQTPAFRKFLAVMQQAVDAAHNELTANQDPRFDAHLARVYRERRQVLDFANQYMAAVIAKRRDTIKELLRNMNIPESMVERNQDISLNFLNTHFNPEARNETAQSIES